jgi:uncharacterized oxidoreductase
MNLHGNSVLITGGATGIGFELARVLVERGNDVTICGRRRERLDEAKAKVPALNTIVADVSDPAAREHLAEAVPQTNILVNNAGVQHLFDFRDASQLARIDEEITINLTALIHLTTLFIPVVERNEQPAIVNVSSGLAFAPLARIPIYCATKAAVHSLTMSLRHQLRDSGVRVFEVIPPIVTSELGAYHRPQEVKDRALPADAAVARMIEGLEQDEPEIAIGEAEHMRAKREGMFPFMNR